MTTPELINSSDSRYPFVDAVDPQAVFLFDQMHNGQLRTVKARAEQLFSLGSGGGHTIAVNGVNLPQRAALSFLGAISGEDNEPSDETRLLLENLANKYAIAWGNTSQVIANNTPTILDFGAIYHSRGGAESATQLVSDPGIYLLGACVRFPAASGHLTLKIQVDTQEVGIEQSLPAGANSLTLNCSGEVNMSSSSEWRAIAIQTSGAPMTVEILRIWGSWRSGDAAPPPN